MSLRYAQIERAIAGLHFAGSQDDALFKTFRTRVRNFGKVGLAPNSPGSGNKASYTMRDAFFWAFCFELAEVGLPPAIIKTIMEAQGDNVIRYCLETPSDRREDRFFFISGAFLLWSLSQAAAEELALNASGIYTFTEIATTRMNRMLLINLSALRDNLNVAIEKEI